MSRVPSFVNMPTRDVHVTLRLTCRLMNTLPGAIIHPLLKGVFPSETSERCVESEVLLVCKSIPRSPGVFKGTVLAAIEQSVSNNEVWLRSHVVHLFYLALLPTDHFEGYSKDSLSTPDRQKRALQFYQAIRLKFEKKPIKETVHIVFAFILRLVHWEWSDRYRMVIQALELPYYFQRDGISDRLCVVFSHYNMKWLNEVAALLSRRWFRIPKPELIRKTRVFGVDLASFTFALRQLFRNVNVKWVTNQSFYQEFVDLLQPQELDVCKRVELFFIFVSKFPYEALLVENRVNQREYSLLVEMGMSKTKTWMTTDEAVEFILHAHNN